MATDHKITALGDSAVTVNFGQTIDEATNDRVLAFTSYIEKHPFKGLIEVVSAYTSVTVHYDPYLVHQSLQMCLQNKKLTLTPYDRMVNIITDMLEQTDNCPNPPMTGRLINIPVCYGGEFGPDLKDVASHNDLSVDEVVKIHTGSIYRVFMLGFAPGFPYLGGLSNKINAPRRRTPRLKIPAGSVGIAGGQTGVYPMETPGGWQIIGQTPKILFNANNHSPSLLHAGDTIQFVPLSVDEFVRWEDGQ